MRRVQGKFWLKILLILIIPVQAWAQIDEDEEQEDYDLEDLEIESGVYQDFNEALIPYADVYDDSWDDANVDSPFFKPSLMSYDIRLELVDSSDCFYVMPIQGVVTSRYGWRWNRMHRGIDLNLNTGDSVRAAFDGVVRMARFNPGGYGTYIVIRHYNGLETLYGHLSQSLVSRNEPVRAGQVIGYGGSTGRSTGPHLHFETRFKGQAFNPERIIDFNSKKLINEVVYLERSWFMNPTSEVPRTQPTKSKYHTVKKGDTLSSIARKNGTTVSKICKLNGISAKTVLRIGRKIRVK